jgi:hypothetical protein
MKNKTDTLHPVHKHVLATVLAVGLACVFGLVIYPKLAILAELPTKPQDVRVDVDAENAVATWSAPALEGDTPIVGYNISYYETSRPGSAITDSVDDRTLEYSIALSGLEAGVEYTFEITASNSGGAGDSNTAVFNTPAGAIPTAPIDCSGTPGDREVYLLCSAPADMAGGTVISYLVYYGTKDYVSIEVPSTKGLTYVVTSLTNDLAYNFYVTAKNSNDVEGEASAIFTVTPVSAGGGGGGDPLEISTEPTVTTTSTTATIHWTTNKEASSKVYYGPTQDIKGISPEYNTTPRVSDHQTQITGLISCMTYWFKSESFDADGNSVQSLGGEFTTAGCKGNSAIVVSDVQTVTAVTGATASAKVSGKGIEVVAPAAIKNGFDIAIEASKLEQEKVAGAISSPTGKGWVGDNAYLLKALEDEVTEVDGNFDQAVSVSIDYTDADLDGYDRSTLKIYHYEDATGWMPLTSCTDDYDASSGTGTVTCNTTSFSVFGLFGSTGSSSSSGSRPGNSSVTTNVTTTPTSLPATNTPQTDIPVVSGGTFTKDLWYGLRDSDVKRLQAFLNSRGFSIAASGNGSVGNETEYFGPLTRAALIRFQEGYRAEILTPIGLLNGTGFFGSNTRAFVNSMR